MGDMSAGAINQKVNSFAKRDSLIKGTPDLYQPFDKDEAGWEESNWSNNGPFNNKWRPDHIKFNNGIMTITLDKKECPANCDEYPYVSGEYRTTAEKYSYGYYETRMKAAKGPGLVAGTFFTYAGVYGERSHNEIDFEVLGNDPTQVQLNYYYAGKGKDQENKEMINLGFDASKDFHNYGFIWKPNSIEWYIDGKRVHKATKDIPQKPCKIMVNFWPGTEEVSGWLGGVYNGNGGQVQYDWIKYKKVGGGQATETTETSSMPQVKKSSLTEKIGEEILGNLINASGGFNGASAKVNGDQLSLVANEANDAGIYMLLKRPVEGKISFEYSGKVAGGFRNNGFTVIFIKSGPGGNYKKDMQLGEESFSPGNKAEKATIDIPEGTDKINVVLVGQGSINIKLENVKIGK